MNLYSSLIPKFQNILKEIQSLEDDPTFYQEEEVKEILLQMYKQIKKMVKKD